MTLRTTFLTVVLPALLVPLPPVAAQAPEASPVRYTEVLRYPVRRTVQVPGTVESPTVSLVAAEVEGVVDRMLAREGDAVREAQPVVRLRTTNLELRLRVHDAELKEARARKDLARRNLERARDLFDSTVISQADLDDAFSEFTAWEGRVESLVAEMERVRLDLERCTIRAPFGGTVVSERTESGEWIGVGDPVVEILSVSELDVLVPVPERYFRTLDRDLPTTVTFEALPGVEIEGRVRAIIPRADPRARTFPVKIAIDNPDGRIAPGMLGRVVLRAGEPYLAILVPKDALVARGDGTVVFRIGDDDTVSTVPVDPGVGFGSWIVVEGELEPGQRIVTRGNERLQPGRKVRGQMLEYPVP